MIVCNEAHRFLVAEQLRQLKVTPRATILEPFGRNTAPAIALAAHAALKGLGRGCRRRRPGAAGAAGRSRDPRRAGVSAGGARGARGGGGRQARHLRHRRERARDRLRLHPARRSRAAAAFRIARFVEKPDAERGARVRQLRATTTGTAACSCSARAATCRSSRASRPEMARICEAAFRGAQRGSGFHAHRCRRASRPARPTRSTTPSWRRPRTRWSCRSMPAGATSARGRRCTRRAKRTRTATSRTAM